MNPDTSSTVESGEERQGGVRIEPMDRYNIELVQNAHPDDHVNPEPQGCYNLVVVGADTAGLVSAAIAAGLGARVALVEGRVIGGDCLNVGWVPSKAIIRSSRVVADVRQAAAYGIAGDGAADCATVMERMHRLRSGISPTDSVHRYAGLGVDVFLGEAGFTAPDAVQVGGAVLHFKKAIIATIARGTAPPIEGLADTGYLTNETVFLLTELPREVVAIGGGPIGCELAQAFGRLGSRLTPIESGPQFLAREDPDAAIVLAGVFEREGVGCCSTPKFCA